MLFDELFMNVETGEVLPGTAAIREFYRSHGALEAWTDIWVPTGEMSEEILTAPDFASAIRV